MPNTSPPVTSCAQAGSYRQELLAVEPRVDFLMTLYLSHAVSADDLRANARANHVQGVIHFLARPDCPRSNATPWAPPPTHSTDSRCAAPRSPHASQSLEEFYPLFAEMERLGLSLHIHGEQPGSSPLAAEAEFVPHVENVARAFPRLKVVAEHVSTRASLDAVSRVPNLAASVTPHHLFLTTEDVLHCSEGVTLQNITERIRDPHLYCKPLAKSAADRDALLEALKSRSPKIFLGSDSAPHPRSSKASGNPPAGVFSQPFLMQASLRHDEVLVPLRAAAALEHVDVLVEGEDGRVVREVLRVVERGRQVRREHGAHVPLRQPLHDLLDGEQLLQRLRDGLGEHRPHQRQVLAERVAVHDALLEPDDLAGQDVREVAARLAGAQPLVPQRVELPAGVALDDFENLVDVLLPELGAAAALPDRHLLVERVVVQHERRQHLEAAAGDAALVGRRVLEENDPLVLQDPPRVLRDEDVGALHDELVDALALFVKEPVHVEGRDGRRPATARVEQVDGAPAQVELVPELVPPLDLGPVGQTDVDGVLGDLEAPRREQVRVVQHAAGVSPLEPERGQPAQLVDVEPLRVVQHAAAVKHRQRLGLGAQQRVAPEVAVRPTREEPRDVLLLHAVFLQQLVDVGLDARRRHPVHVVRDAPHLRLLARGEGPPELEPADLGVVGRPVHQPPRPRVLVRPQEVNLLLLEPVHHLVVGHHHVNQPVDVAHEAAPRVHLGQLLVARLVQQNHALAAALGDVLVLQTLRVGQVVGLVEDLQLVPRKGLLREGLHHPDPAPRYLAEPDVEAPEVGPQNHHDAVGRLRVVVFGQEARVQPEGQTHLLRHEEVRPQRGRVKGKEQRQYLRVLLVVQGLDQLLQGPRVRVLVGALRVELRVVQPAEVLVQPLQNALVRAHRVEDLVRQVRRNHELRADVVELRRGDLLLRRQPLDEGDVRPDAPAEVLDEDRGAEGVGHLGHLQEPLVEDGDVGRVRQHAAQLHRHEDRVHPVLQRQVGVGHLRGGQRRDEGRDDADVVRERVDVLGLGVAAVVGDAVAHPRVEVVLDVLAAEGHVDAEGVELPRLARDGYPHPAVGLYELLVELVEDVLRDGVAFVLVEVAVQQLAQPQLPRLRVRAGEVGELQKVDAQALKEVVRVVEDGVGRTEALHSPDGLRHVPEVEVALLDAALNRVALGNFLVQQRGARDDKHPSVVHLLDEREVVRARVFVQNLRRQHRDHVVRDHLRVRGAEVVLVEAELVVVLVHCLVDGVVAEGLELLDYLVHLAELLRVAVAERDIVTVVALRHAG
ncbi:dihydroorotase [Babesia caballi]|uniref:Dihydroorotase n=1 Tax=Babesia caballi TaxID=5871 RepID=A0AAV4LN13_BABCB|nr:dihydroorotase [Babesia caballi]